MMFILKNFFKGLTRLISIGIIPIILGMYSCTKRGINFTQEESGFGKVNDKPNVILLITDDQGYGDLACLGNPVIKTPNMDRLYDKSIRLTNFHVSPTCAPTRAALMTGRYNDRTGVWHTIMGRSLLHKDEVTMANIFKDNGYHTAIFGKWHLGDNYPFRPQDRGFMESIIHGGGVVGETPDYWGNKYFDDIYLHNGRPEKFDGYCTDIWFNEATKFIEDNKDHPFFLYLSTNAAHGPLNVLEKYISMYEDKVQKDRARFYGMITNIDENIGMLIEKLKELELYRNTIFIFMTDNGTASGVSLDREGFPVDGFNAGMRGKKGSIYEGGHRVPCFIHWSEGGLEGGRDVEGLTAHIDLLPTLIELCGLRKPEGIRFDGMSIEPLLKGEFKNWPNRILFVDSQLFEYLIKYKQFAIMTDSWRLIGNYGGNLSWRRSEAFDHNQPLTKSPMKGLKLYDMYVDPRERKDVADEHPEVVKRLFNAYEDWWEDISERSDEYCRIIIGSDKENPTILTSQSCHDWGIYSQQHVRAGVKGNGYWTVEVVRSGIYKIELRRFPREVNEPISSSISLCEMLGELDSTRIDLNYRLYQLSSNPIKARKARIKIQDVDKTKFVDEDAISVKFRVSLETGKAFLKTWLIEESGDSNGVYYVYVTRLP